MRALRAFLLGALAAGAVAFAVAVAVAAAAQAGSASSLELSLGPLVLVALERTDGGTATTFGAGLPLVALAGGLVNAAGAILLGRR
jgi:hypothetical protein